MRIYVSTIIHSAHKLNLPYESPCGGVHGHSYKVEVWIEGAVNASGMIIDYQVIKKVIRELDHKMINDYIPQPTAENMVKYFLDKLEKELKDSSISTIDVRVWETENSWADEIRHINRD